MREVGVAVDPSTIGLAAAAAAAGSLAPDLDHPFSKASFGIPTALLGYGGGFLIAAWVQNRSSGPQIFDLSLLGPGYFVAARTAVALGLLLLAASLVFGLLFTHRGPVQLVWLRWAARFGLCSLSHGDGFPTCSRMRPLPWASRSYSGLLDRTLSLVSRQSLRHPLPPSPVPASVARWLRRGRSEGQLRRCLFVRSAASQWCFARPSVASMSAVGSMAAATSRDAGVHAQ